jgi:3-phenylpropionate/cinnamic acid dioxygenase small subunit
LGRKEVDVAELNENEIRRLVAEMDIRDLLARIAQLTDRGDVEDYLRLFTEDASWEMPDNPAIGVAASRRVGHEAIAGGVRERRAARHQGPDARTMHFVSTTSIEVDGDSATALSYFQYIASASTEPRLHNVGRYYDSMRRTKDGWKLSSRVITFG